MTRTSRGKGAGEKSPPLVYSTTIGRAKFPEFMQLSYGEKAVIGFDRYGRILGAIVPVEAVKVLAGREREVDPHVRAQIERAAAHLLAQMPPDLGMGGFARGSTGKLPRATVELEEIAARRRKRAVRKRST